MSAQADRQRAALDRMAEDDPELAARLILMTLPGGRLEDRRHAAYVLDVEELGALPRVGRRAAAPAWIRQRAATTTDVDFRLQADARTLADLVTGARGPLGLMMRGRLRIRGKRRKALKLRQMSSGELSMADVVEAGGTLDPDVLYRSLAVPDRPRLDAGARVHGRATWSRARAAAPGT